MLLFFSQRPGLLPAYRSPPMPPVDPFLAGGFLIENHVQTLPLAKESPNFGAHCVGIHMRILVGSVTARCCPSGEIRHSPDHLHLMHALFKFEIERPLQGWLSSENAAERP